MRERKVSIEKVGSSGHWSVKKARETFKKAGLENKI